MVDEQVVEAVAARWIDQLLDALRPTETETARRSSSDFIRETDLVTLNVAGRTQCANLAFYRASVVR